MNRSIAAEIIKSWYPEYQDIEILSIYRSESILDMVIVSYLYKRDFPTHTSMTKVPQSINIHKKDYRDYKINQILQK